MATLDFVRKDRIDRDGAFVRWLWALRRDDGEHHVEVRISRWAIRAVNELHRVADEVAEAVLSDGMKAVEAVADWPLPPAVIDVTASCISPQGGRPPRSGRRFLSAARS